MVNLLDREASGVMLVAKTAAARAFLKNEMGSLAFRFNYRFLATETDVRDDGELLSDLPLAIHHTKPLALVSHKTGKKTVTQFRRLERFGEVALWESESPYDRFHQVRVHAAEVGLRLLGEEIYGWGTKSGSHGLYGGLCLHLARLDFVCHGEKLSVEAPYPGPLVNLLRRLERDLDQR